MKTIVLFAMLIVALTVSVAACAPAPTPAPTAAPPTAAPKPTSAPVATSAPAATTAPTTASAADDYNKIIEASKQENALLVYSIMSANNWKPVIEAFNQKYPWIQVETVDLGSYEVFERYYSESASKAKTGDMIITSAPDAWQEFIAKGEVAPYKSTEDAKVPDWSKLAPNIYTVSSDPMFFIWNKQTLPTPPKTMAELAALIDKDPAKFEKKLTTYDAETNATGFAINWFWIKKKGEDGWKILTSIGKTHPTLQSSAGNMVNATLSGEASMGFFVSAISVFPKYPAAEPVMGNGMIADGTPILVRGMAITKAAAHPNSAKLMVDFILSQEGQIKFAEGGLTAYRPDVADKAKIHLSKLAAAVGEQNLIPFYFDKDLMDKAKKDAFIARWKKAIGKP